MGMRYIESDSTDPHYNLALEEYVFNGLPKEDEYFMLWQNDNAIIIGKHQNAVEEINAAFVRERDIKVVRRLSGGGAVYHDLGNLNFTFVSDGNENSGLDLASFCVPVVKALASLGVEAEISGRNDITIDGKKFSGNAQYQRGGRVMHHGTIMFDSNLETLSAALRVSADKIESKGVKSVRSRVTNVKEHLPDPRMTVEDFKKALRDFMARENGMEAYELTAEDRAAVEALRGRYESWEWNYGNSPAYDILKERRVEGCGKVQAYMKVEKGLIKSCAMRGDYFGAEDAAELEGALVGRELNEGSIRAALEGIDVGRCIRNLTPGQLTEILLQ